MPTHLSIKNAPDTLVVRLKKALFPFRVASLPIRCRLDSGGDSHEEMHIPTMFSSCRLYDIGAKT